MSTPLTLLLVYGTLYLYVRSGGWPCSLQAWQVTSWHAEYVLHLEDFRNFC